LDAFRAADYFRIDYYVGSTDEYQLLIESGKIRAALVIPPDYDVQISGGEGASPCFVLDGSDGSVGARHFPRRGSSVNRMRPKCKRVNLPCAAPFFCLLRQSKSAPRFGTTPIFNRSAYFMIPGVIGMILSFITTILTATTIVRERERGTIEQLIVTPIRSWELIVGKILPYVILAFIETFEILIIGHLVFDVPVRGSLLLITLASGLFLMSSLGIGLFASTIANTQQEAMLTVMMFNLPMIFLSGFFFPCKPCQNFCSLFLCHSRCAITSSSSARSCSKALALLAIQSEIIPLTIFGIVIMGIAALRFRKRLD
jgi:ABC-2 type transport system permease protein